MYKFGQMFMNEKMGIISRAYQECDEFRISQTINSFINNISQNIYEPYKITELILDKAVSITYQPNQNYNNIIGVTLNSNEIRIYQEYDAERYLEFKYFLVHELVHIIQGIYEKQIDDYTLGDKIKYKLLRPYIDEFTNPDEYKDIMNFLCTFYYININEIHAWNHQAYEKAFSYKLKNPTYSNHQIMNLVLNDLYMTKQYLELAIDNIYNKFGAYTCIICILIGHFSFISSMKQQQFFDKEIFKLNSVKKLKNDIYNLMHTMKYADANKIIKVIKYTAIPENIMELYEDFKIITNSFINHFKYWFDKLQKKLDKAIQLGIDDANNS